MEKWRIAPFQSTIEERRHLHIENIEERDSESDANQTNRQSIQQDSPMAAGRPEEAENAVI